MHPYKTDFLTTLLLCPVPQQHPACLLKLVNAQRKQLLVFMFHILPLLNIQIFHNVDPVSKVHLRGNSCSKLSFLLQPKSQSGSCAAVGSYPSVDAVLMIL